MNPPFFKSITEVYFVRYLNLFFRGVLCDALRFAKGVMSSTSRIADAAASAARVSVGAAR